jgi:hypothetical protein
MIQFFVKFSNPKTKTRTYTVPNVSAATLRLKAQFFWAQKLTAEPKNQELL